MGVPAKSLSIGNEHSRLQGEESRVLPRERRPHNGRDNGRGEQLHGRAESPGPKGDDSARGAVPRFLTAEQRHKILVEWNQTQADFPRDACVHQLFEAQAEKSPDAIALVFRDQQLTFRALNHRANQLARHLKNHGVGPETLVGLCVKRSPDMVVGILAVLKAGGAYVPLDPTYPRERLAYMLDDSQTPVLLTQSPIAATLPPTQATLICIDSQWDKIARECTDNLPNAATPDNLAYVIYTSGSTGRPKGAMILHRGVVNYLTWAARDYSLAGGNGGGAAGTGAPVQSSVSFDLTVTSLFTPLITGRRVFLISEDLDINGLAATLQTESDFNLVKITPAHLELLSRQLTPEQAARATRAFIIGGENVSAESLAFWRQHAPNTRLVNEYGPTETVVGCCVYTLERGEQRTGTIPIGRPIANTQLYILDDSLQPVALGDAGELCIGGAGVARGYLHQPELTAQKFVPNPFSGIPGDRLYRTGDLCRYLPDGNIECLGRIDHQVKIRGYRVELGEIEAAIKLQPNVQECAVIAREDTPGDKRLVAYIVCPASTSIAPAELRAALKQRLPAYMVPSAFVFVAQLPLTPNGKLDRKSLPAPAPDQTSSPENFVPPRTATEIALAKLFGEVLGIKTIGTRDDFFDLGGHSLLAARLVNEINHTLHAGLGILHLFQQPTVERLAAVVDSQRSTGTPQPVVICLKKAASAPPSAAAAPPLFFIYAGPDELRLAESLDTPRGIYGIEVPWPAAWRVAATERRGAEMPTLQQLAAPYVAALAAHADHGPCILAGYSFAGLVAFEVAHQFQQQGGRVEQVILLDAWGKFLSPREVWHNIWRPEFPTTTASSPRAPNFFARLQDSWRVTPWTLQQESGKLRALFRRPPAPCAPAPSAANPLDADTLTHLLDDTGAALPWGLVYQIYMHARSAYRYHPLASRGTLFRADATDKQDVALIDTTLGWANLFTGGLSLVPIPGTHHSILRPPHLQFLAEQLNESLGVTD